MTRVNIEIDDELHRRSKAMAAMKGITLIEFINNALIERLKREKLK